MDNDPVPLHTRLRQTALIRAVALAPILACLGCGGTAPANSGQPVELPPVAVTLPADGDIGIGASYSIRTDGDDLFVRVENRSAEPLCFEASDLTPGSLVTHIGNARGDIVNDSPNAVLALYRGVNLAGPLAVIRPHDSLEHIIDLRGYRGSAQRFQIGVGYFRCALLFNDRSHDIAKTVVTSSYRLHRGRVVPDEPFVVDPN